MLIPRHLVILILAPSVENAGLNLVALDHVRDINILVLKLQRLQSIHIPLMKCFLLQGIANFIADHAEGLEFIMAISIEV